MTVLYNEQATMRSIDLLVNTLNTLQNKKLFDNGYIGADRVFDFTKMNKGWGAEVEGICKLWERMGSCSESETVLIGTFEEVQDHLNKIYETVTYSHLRIFRTKKD
jgi:hypothetical protein